jgi:hypothetical protein
MDVTPAGTVHGFVGLVMITVCAKTCRINIGINARRIAKRK